MSRETGFVKNGKKGQAVRMSYEELLRATGPEGVCREGEAEELPEEMEVQSLWFSGLLGSEFVTTEGERVRILAPGEWNHGAGPDFQLATVEVAGRIASGPVEIDLEARNWERHGHDASEAFSGVVLHVVLAEEGVGYFTRTLENRAVPRIRIAPEVVREALGKPRLTQALARPGRCLTPLAGLAEGDLAKLLEEAGRHRAHRKAVRLQRVVRFQGRSQALWEAFAEALGYSRNRLPMRLVAQRLPVAVLRKLPPDEVPAVLFGAAGFLGPDLHEKAPPDSQAWVEELWKTWWQHRIEFEFSEERKLPWDRGASRPGNHPERRLAALAAAVAVWPSLLKAASESPPFSRFKKLATGLRDPFWDHHHTLTSKRSAKPVALLGESRLKEFLINTLYPMAVENEKSAWGAFRAVHGGAPNQKTRRCQERLFGNSERRFPKAWEQQALLQIYQDFCLEDRGDCKECPFPEQLGEVFR